MLWGGAGLAKEFPGDRKLSEELSGWYNKLGQLEQALNHVEGAIAAFEEGYAVAAGLVEAEGAQTIGVIERVVAQG